MSDEDTLFVEWETDQPGPPVSYFVTGTPSQADEIRALLEKTLEAWQEPYVGLVVPTTFEQFMQDFKENWMEEDDTDDDLETANQPGDARPQ